MGTYADKVPKQVKTKTADQLAALVDKTDCSKAAVWQTTEGGVLFSVYNSSAGSKHWLVHVRRPCSFRDHHLFINL